MLIFHGLLEALMTLGEAWQRKIRMAFFALSLSFILNFLTEGLLLAKHSFLIFIAYWTDFAHMVVAWSLNLFFFLTIHLLVFSRFFFLLLLARSDTSISSWSNLSLCFFTIHQMLLYFCIVWAQWSFAIIALNGRSFTFIEKMVADIWFHHNLPALLTLISPVITVTVELFVNELIVSHLCRAPIEFTAELQFIVV